MTDFADVVSSLMPGHAGRRGPDEARAARAKSGGVDGTSFATTSSERLSLALTSGGSAGRRPEVKHPVHHVATRRARYVHAERSKQATGTSNLVIWPPIDHQLSQAHSARPEHALQANIE